MTKIPLPFTDAFLLLTPAGGGVALVLILILVAAALVLLYRHEFPGVPNRFHATKSVPAPRPLMPTKLV